MARRRRLLPALAGVVSALVLAGTLAPSAGAAASGPDPEIPSGPSVEADAAPRVASARAAARSRATAPRRHRAEDDYDAPLEVTIDELTPGALPRHGPVVVRGRVTNVDLETWSGIALYPMFGAGCATCPPPMTTDAELTAAADSDPEAQVGERYTGVRYDVTELQPGESASYTLRIPQSALRARFGSARTGVYWFGVHALGASASTPDDRIADGRARTFLPVVARGSHGVVDTAVLVPLRARITHAVDGQLGRPASWQRALSFQGSVGGPLAFGAAAGGKPVTWLLDPAVPDAVRELAQGNRPREIRPVPKESDEPSPSEQPSDGESSPAAEKSDKATEGALPPTDPAVRTAEDWLRQAQSVLTGSDVALLPYGDVDVAAAAESMPTIYATARRHSSDVLEEWGVTGTPVVAPPNGYLDKTGIDSVGDDALVLLGDQMFPREAFGERPLGTARVDGRHVVVRASGAAEGGPGPGAQLSPIALRQRLLSEAAVRLAATPAEAGGAEEPPPLVVVLPSSLQAAGADAFWDGLDVSWLRLVGLDGLGATSAPSGSAGSDVDATDLHYPKDQSLLEMEPGVLVEVDRVISAAHSLQSILGDNYRIYGQLLDEALAGASYALRSDPQAASRLGRTRGWIDEELAKVTIDAPSGVTLSSSSGGFNVSVRNGLEFPVTVRIEARTDDGARIGIANPVQLAARSRSSVPVTAKMSRTGVHNVYLRVTDLDGREIGDTDGLPIRSGQVGVVIWAIIGSGVGILMMAIAIRLYRRIRAHRRRSAEGPDVSRADIEVGP